MRELKTALFIARCNFTKWRSNSTVWSMGFLWTCVIVYLSRGMTEFCSIKNMLVTPWAFVFLLDGHSQMIMYVALLIILFAHAPFCSQHTPLLLIRSGKQSWFAGQVIYILLTALIVPLYTFVVLLLVLLPRLGFSLDWGGVLRSIAMDSGLVAQHGISTVIHPSQAVIEHYSAVEATVLTLLMLWLLGVLMGTTILFFNLALKPGAGIVVAACMGAWSYFTVLGFWVYTTAIQRYAICLWYTPSYLKPLNSNSVSLPVAAGIQLGLCLIFIVCSTVLFCRRDTVFESDD